MTAQSIGDPGYVSSPTVSASSAPDSSASGCEQRRLSDLLAARGTVAGPFVMDEEALKGLLDEDPVLYTAHRDQAVRPLLDEDGPFFWRADLVSYSGGVLPDREPVRSVGHWNPTTQVEVFQVLDGRVLLLIGDATDPATVSLAVYGPGDMAVVPPGWFHLTGSPWGPAVVYNIYTDRKGSGGTDIQGKYHSRQPMPYLITMDGVHPALTEVPGVPVGPRPITSAGPLRPSALPLPDDLRRLMDEGSDEDLLALRDAIQSVCADGWPRTR
ncbi:hypothetical protein ACFWBS_57585 [Streptomyces mirabilis]|uniref:hypothetical protein n=1 Tax=Streptomyces mirabilis TaxID=68239 RepID=UPI003660910A